MSKPVVAVVQPFSSGAMLAPLLREAGMSPVAVMDYEGPSLEPVRSSHHPENYDAIINHHGDIERTVRNLRALSTTAVIPAMEASLPLSQLCADAVTPDEANVTELMDARRHKYLMHQALAAAGLPVARQICSNDPAEVEAWIEREGLTGRDLVIKPPASAGIVNVGRAPGGRGWREQFDAINGERDKHDILAEAVLVMEHLTGTEYAVDTVSHHGRHSLTDIIRYDRAEYGEGIAVYNAVEWMPYAPDDPVLGPLMDYALAALDAVGLRQWAAHTEIMMTEDGPRLLEVNPRFAGIGHPTLTKIATGESQLTRAVDVCAGRGGELPDGFTLRQNVLAVFVKANTSGVVRNAEILDEARSLPSFHSTFHLVSTGDRVEASNDIHSSMMMGYFTLAHERSEQLYEDRDVIRKLEQQLIIDPEG
ncbi:ATP-grasp domain-containing protein [Actinomadura harenae]|uniref:ATP-grasp domain-containing protein n=1 Tax=Actinomadura harenae TaxID=2483351 RepID=A0A3M2MJB6_9ACTN|nr:ATP-grasp domain-containing protein [Actinomadura harenae]RMI47448.1 ATP-grasp domain-containing protein [Actinomadura harenae]